MFFRVTDMQGDRYGLAILGHTSSATDHGVHVPIRTDSKDSGGKVGMNPTIHGLTATCSCRMTFTQSSSK